MSNIALATRTIGDVVTIVESVPNLPATSVYHTVSPQDARPPFVVIEPAGFQQVGQGLAAEDWGKLAARFRLLCYGQTAGQAVAVRDQVMLTPVVPWGDDWSFNDEALTSSAHPTPNPTQWFAVFEVTEVDHGPTTPVALVRTWNDAGDTRTWNATDERTWSS